MVNLPSPPLVAAEQLRRLLGRTALKVFDVRGSWGADTEAAQFDYDQGHIPGAVLLDWRTHFIEKGIDIGLASVANEYEATVSFRDLGISEHDAVVLYDHHHHMLAGRVWWAMQHWGFANVRVLDGGWQNWQKQGFDLSTDPAIPEAGSFVPQLNSLTRASLSDVADHLGVVHLIDARGAAGYAGKTDIDRTGHIPTAINIPYSRMLDNESGCFKHKDALRAVFEHHLPEFGHSPIISSCGSGYAGTVTLLALRTLGIHAPLYDGSFAEWKQDINRPVEQSVSA